MSKDRFIAVDFDDLDLANFESIRKVFEESMLNPEDKAEIESLMSELKKYGVIERKVEERKKQTVEEIQKILDSAKEAALRSPEFFYKDFDQQQKSDHIAKNREIDPDTGEVMPDLVDDDLKFLNDFIADSYSDAEK